MKKPFWFFSASLRSKLDFSSKWSESIYSTEVYSRSKWMTAKVVWSSCQWHHTHARTRHSRESESDMFNVYIRNRSTSSIDFKGVDTFYALRERPHSHFHSNQSAERSMRPNRFILKLTSFPLFEQKHTWDLESETFLFCLSISSVSPSKSHAEYQTRKNSHDTTSPLRS